MWMKAFWCLEKTTRPFAVSKSIRIMSLIVLEPPKTKSCKIRTHTQFSRPWIAAAGTPTHVTDRDHRSHTHTLQEHTAFCCLPCLLVWWLRFLSNKFLVIVDEGMENQGKNIAWGTREFIQIDSRQSFAIPSHTSRRQIFVVPWVSWKSVGNACYQRPATEKQYGDWGIIQKGMDFNLYGGTTFGTLSCCFLFEGRIQDFDTVGE